MLNRYINLHRLIHNKLIHSHRIKILELYIYRLLPKDIKTILDIGCGDGLIDYLLEQKLPKIKIQGLEILKRNKCLISCKHFDGKRVPYADNSFDLCMLIDVLHHTSDINLLLKEAKRVSKKYILIKDHIYINIIELLTLKFMDWVGNKPYGVKLVYNYQNEEGWKKLLRDNKLNVIKWKKSLPIYIFPFKYIFGRKMHLLILLKKARS